MFSRLDKFLKIAKKIVDITALVMVIAGFIAMIVLFSTLRSYYTWVGFVVFAGSALVAGSIWFLGNLGISKMVDVKLIRNKLYGLDNTDLSMFLEKKLTKEELAAAEQKSKLIAEKKARYKNLLNSGVISQEEYDNEIAKLG